MYRTLVFTLFLFDLYILLLITNVIFISFCIISTSAILYVCLLLRLYYCFLFISLRFKLIRYYFYMTLFIYFICMHILSQCTWYDYICCNLHTFPHSLFLMHCISSYFIYLVCNLIVKKEYTLLLLNTFYTFYVLLFLLFSLHNN